MDSGYTLQQVRYFLEVARRGKISQAAEALFVTQSSLSKTIKKLEDCVGVALFTREHGGVDLTPEGVFLQRAFSEALLRMDESVAKARTMAGEGEHVSVGLFLTSGYMGDFESVRAALARFSAENPRVRVALEYLTYRDLRRLLASGKIDVAFTSDSAVGDDPGIEVKRICPAGWGIAMSSRHPMAVAGRLDMEALAEEDFLFLSEEETLTPAAMNLERCLEYGFRPGREVVVQNSMTLLELVRQGKGMFLYIGSVMPGDGIATFPLPGVANPPYICAAWRSDCASPHVARLVEMLPSAE